MPIPVGSSGMVENRLSAVHIVADTTSLLRFARRWVSGVGKQRRRPKGDDGVRRTRIRQLRRDQMWNHVQRVRSEIPGRSASASQRGKPFLVENAEFPKTADVGCQFNMGVTPKQARCAEDASPEVGARNPTTGPPILTHRAGISKAARLGKACARANI